MTCDPEKYNLIPWVNIVNAYLESHIKQRFLFVNYFIVIVTSLVVVEYFSLRIFNGHKMLQATILAVLALSMLLVTFIFWMLEERVKFLKCLSEKVLINIEKSLFTSKDYMLFHIETEKTTKKRRGNIFFSYSICFRTLYIATCVLYIFFTVAVICIINFYK